MKNLIRYIHHVYILRHINTIPILELDRQLMDFMYHYDQQKRELDHRERAFVQILRSYGFPNMSRPSQSRTRTRPGHRISKQLVTRAGPKMLAGITDQAANTELVLFYFGDF